MDDSDGSFQRSIDYRWEKILNAIRSDLRKPLRECAAVLLQRRPELDPKERSAIERTAAAMQERLERQGG